MKTRLLALALTLSFVLAFVPATIARDADRIINPNETITDNLPTSTTERLYQFTLTQPGKVWVTFEHELSGNSTYWTVTLLDRDGAAFSFDKDISTAQSTTKTVNDYLGAGTYFVCVKPYASYSWSEAPYTLKLNYDPNNGQYEAESNNTIATANTIAVNQPIIGNTDNGKDVDYFKFTLTAPGKVWATFEHEVSGSNTYWNVSLLNSDGAEFSFDKDISTAQSTTKTVNDYLGAGTYFVRVKTYASYSWYNADYKLTLNYDANKGQYETELNNTIATANAITAGKAITGSTDSNKDVDYFKFTLTKTSNVSVNFQHDPIGTSTSGMFTGEFFDKNSQPVGVQFTSKADQTLLNSTPFQLLAGTYYLRVSAYGSYSWTQADYQLTVNVTPVPVVKAAKVKLSKTKLKLKKGGQFTLLATVAPANTTNAKVTYKSSNKKVATVSKTGVVKAKKKGKATITATAADGSKKSAKCKITVK